MKRKITLERVMVGIILVLFAVIIVKSLTGVAGRKTKYATVLAEYDTFYITDTVEGYVIRNEDILPGSVNGTLIPVVAEGTKVEKDGEVARVFSNADYASYIDRSSRISEELEYYTNLKTSADDYVKNVSVYNRNILSAVCRYARAVETGSASSASSAADDVREYITVKQIVMGEEINVEEKIASLTRELESIEAVNLGNRYSPVTIGTSGYYFSEADGLEGQADYKDVKNITCDTIDSLMNKDPSPGRGLGRIVYDPVWYFVCVMNKTQAARLTKLTEYNVTFRDSSAGQVRMRVESMNEDNGTGRIAIVFSSKVMNPDVAALRKVSADVCFEKYSGIVVPNSAVRSVPLDVEESVTDEFGNEVRDGSGEVIKQTVKKDFNGVFVRFNNVAKFRRINILYRNSEYTIAEYITDNVAGTYLKLNDEIYVEGVKFENEHIVEGGYF